MYRMFEAVLWIRTGWNADPDQAFSLLRFRIRIQGAKPMWNHADPDPDPCHTLLSQKVELLHEKYGIFNLSG